MPNKNRKKICPIENWTAYLDFEWIRLDLFEDELRESIPKIIGNLSALQSLQEMYLQ